MIVIDYSGSVDIEKIMTKNNSTLIDLERHDLMGTLTSVDKQFDLSGTLASGGEQFDLRRA